MRELWAAWWLEGYAKIEEQSDEVVVSRRSQQFSRVVAEGRPICWLAGLPRAQIAHLELIEEAGLAFYDDDLRTVEEKG